MTPEQKVNKIVQSMTLDAIEGNTQLVATLAETVKDLSDVVRQLIGEFQFLEARVSMLEADRR